MKELLDRWVELRRRLREPATPDDPTDRDELERELRLVEDKIEAAREIDRGEDEIGGAFKGFGDLNAILGHAIGGYLAAKVPSVLSMPDQSSMPKAQVPVSPQPPFESLKYRCPICGGHVPLDGICVGGMRPRLGVPGHFDKLGSCGYVHREQYDLFNKDRRKVQRRKRKT